MVATKSDKLAFIKSHFDKLLFSGESMTTFVQRCVWPTVVILGVAFFLPCNRLSGQTTGAQDAQKAEADEVAEQSPEDALLEAVKESANVYRTEIKPLIDEHQKASQALYSKMSTERNIISSLEKADDKTLAMIRRERERLNKRLAQINRIEDALTDMNPDGKEKAIANSKEKVAELEEIRKGLYKPVSEQVSEIQMTYRGENKPFGEHFRLIMREQGSGDFSNLKLKHINGQYSHCQVAMGYLDDDKRSVNISLVIANAYNYGNQKREMFQEKYPIISSSKTNLTFLVGKIQVAVYAAKKDSFVEGDLKKFMAGVVDFEKIEKLSEAIHK